MTHLSIHWTPRIGPAQPRGANWAAMAYLTLAHWLSSRPQQAVPAADAGSVRRLADSVRELDPRFAADLHAAADRHEREHAPR